MNKLKKYILSDTKKGSGDTTNANNETTITTNHSSNETTSTNNTTRSNDTYVYGVGILAVFAIGVCVFFEYNTSQVKNKRLVNGK